MSGGVATELDRRIAAALSVAAGSIGPLGGTAKRLNHIHKALKAQRASSRLADKQYARKARAHTQQLRRPHCGGRQRPPGDPMINAAVNALLGSVIGIIALLLAAGLLMTALNMLVWA